ncbi:MAG: glycosyltransferase family 39 protein [Terracidiphilus sp.]|nr:glycosyltransferase family 39 protein [Terracidiphilus sp.]
MILPSLSKAAAALRARLRFHRKERTATCISDSHLNLKPILWMVCVALAIRLAVVPFMLEEWMSPYNVAHYKQGNVAQALLAGKGFGSPFLSDQPSAVLPPIYPLIVAALFGIFGVHTAPAMIAVLALNCIFSAFACIPVFLIARRSFGERVAMWSGWGWALSPYGIYFSAEWAWSTHLLLLCLCWLIYLGQRMAASARPGLWVIFGILSGIAGLTEPSILPVVLFLLILAMKQLAMHKLPALRPVLIASLALVATLSPWMIRNALVFHRFIPMRDSMGMEMYLGNTGNSLHWRSGDHHPNHDAKELAEYNAGELAYMDHKATQADAYIHTHPRWYAWMTVRRALYLWTGYWSFNHQYLAEEPLDPFNIPVATGMTLIAVFGLMFAWRENRFEAIRYSGILLLYPFMYYFVHPEAYRMRPLDPLLVVLGCHALSCVFEPAGEPTAELAGQLDVHEMAH